MTRGMSFVSHPANRLSDGLAWMLSQTRSKPGGKQLQTPDGRWRGRKVRQYLLRVDCFLELLLMSVHIMSGQPGRQGRAFERLAFGWVGCVDGPSGTGRHRLSRHGRTGGLEEVQPSAQRLADTCEDDQEVSWLLQASSRACLSVLLGG
jgi:hypothetical protein